MMDVRREQGGSGAMCTNAGCLADGVVVGKLEAARRSFPPLPGLDWF